ncbi:DUF1849 family protein [Kiloniella laminariae]|uniref:DUF1849 family protein n=1 Tax=Kiloniella laminariae TaxID=454162 RepID=A0ABT4LGX9_9PROT|nr:DUF1849 family protein [Kiloniella laminariae]MCZ4280356.1 DUF1849 family protein [Kiloniella laminariae]
MGTIPRLPKVCIGGGNWLVIPLMVLAGGMGLITTAEASSRLQSAFLPHKAVYDLRLHSSEQGQVSNMNGFIRYDWSGDCKGWLTKNELEMRVGYADGGVHEFALGFSTWESRDGTVLRFAVHETGADAVQHSVVGKASRQGEGEGLKVELSQPEISQMEVGSAIFPTEFLSEIISAAREGQSSLFLPVFDGTGDLEVFNVSVAIVPAEDRGVRAPELSDSRSWRVFLAYYEQLEDTPLPIQEQSLLLYENGVVTEILLDFGEFSVSGEMIRFEEIPTPVCE